jgi:hypothetical protein
LDHLGLEFVVALCLGGTVLIWVMVVVVRLTCPARLAEEDRRRAEEDHGGRMDPADGLQGPWREHLRDRQAWDRVGDRFVMEWQMAGKEIPFGFVVAGATAALIPSSVFETVFPRIGREWLQAVLHPFIAPVAAVFTFIGSMGNGPLAALLWENGVAFAGIMAFLAADFVVPPSLKINAYYYGWRFAGYLAAVCTAAAVDSGVGPRALFALVGLTPDRNLNLAQRAGFELNHTFFLNLLAPAVGRAAAGPASRGREAGATSRHRGSTMNPPGQTAA